MCSRFLDRRALALLANAVFACGVHAATLRVCADPDNAPFSSRDGSGFENRIAALLAGALGSELHYYWWPQRRGFVRNTLDAGVCDVVIGVPAQSDAALTTSPYYRASYVFAYRVDRVRGLSSYDDPRLFSLRIGVPLVENGMAATPPGDSLAQRGITDNVIGYVPLGTAPVAERMMDALADGALDVALLWGPQAGYYAHRQPFEVRLVPAVDARSADSQAFDIAVGVRRNDVALRETLEHALDRIRPQVDAVLREYHVPAISGDRRWSSARTP